MEFAQMLTRPFASLLPASLGLVALVAPARAETLDFFFNGLDLVYDGSVLRDANPEGPSPTLVTIDRPSPFGFGFQPQLLSATFDLFLPGVEDLLSNGVSSVSSAPGGTLSVVIPGGESIFVRLDDVQVSYVALGGIGVFGIGSETSTGFQQPPQAGRALSQTPQAEFVFSATVQQPVVEGGVVKSFSARASGQVTNASVVPEPAAVVAVALLAVLGSAAAAMRVNLG